MLTVAVGVYVLAQLAIAAWASRGMASDADYLVAGRRLGVLAIAMSFFATWFASESVVALTGEVAEAGLSAARIEPLAYGLGIFLLGLFIVGRLRASGAMTLADFLRERYGRSTETLAALAIAASGAIWAAAQLFALAAIVASVSGLGFLPALGAGASVVIAYTLLGGLLGDVVTDALQGVILILVLGVLTVLAFNAAGGLGPAFAAVPAEQWAFEGAGESWVDQVELWLVPIFASIVAQEAIARALGAKTPTVARVGAMTGAGIYVAVCGLPVVLGLIGPHLGLGLGEGEAFVSDLAQALLPPWLYVVFAGALVSAILSSVDSAILAVAAVATESGYRRLRPGATDREYLRAARAMTVLAGLAATAIAASGEGIREIVTAAASVGGVLVAPVLFAIFGRSFGGGAAASAAVIVQFVLLAGLEWIGGVQGGFLISVLGGVAAYVGVAVSPSTGLLTIKQ
ncbi:MAG: hypothetical protein ACFB2Z_10465 [Maricaulaceae bacterium]